MKQGVTRIPSKGCMRSPEGETRSHTDSHCMRSPEGETRSHTDSHDEEFGGCNKESHGLPPRAV